MEMSRQKDGEHDWRVPLHRAAIHCLASCRALRRSWASPSLGLATNASYRGISSAQKTRPQKPRHVDAAKRPASSTKIAHLHRPRILDPGKVVNLLALRSAMRVTRTPCDALDKKALREHDCITNRMQKRTKTRLVDEDELRRYKAVRYKVVGATSTVVHFLRMGPSKKSLI
ncbi:uncharacterized protein MEPE_05559 [Melanopsichium pennsylvanicum]|uniref:Uncharacterized protein n=1 Tax=Melanopsichium pennsylvanicum TaxID=63383 RepID=A0AAJ5C7F5_9BASI|nr:uncharacterized protein MEPE_05559 [Melanopsichium pennsylvanicum]